MYGKMPEETGEMRTRLYRRLRRNVSENVSSSGLRSRRLRRVGGRANDPDRQGRIGYDQIRTIRRLRTFVRNGVLGSMVRYENRRDEE